MSTRRVGIWLIGACGGVGTTAALGLAALKDKLTSPVSLVTELPLFEGTGLEPWDLFVAGGHEIRKSSFKETAWELHKKARLFDEDLLRAVEPTLTEWGKNIRPGTVAQSGKTIANMADLSQATAAESPRQAIQRLRNDYEQFQKANHLEQVVVIHVGSTEPPFPLSACHQSLKEMNAALDLGDTCLPSSSLYAWAAVEAGMPFINFTPSLGATFPAIQELAAATGSPLAGQDGKTGETLMKSVLAPMFALRNWKILSWVGHNIFGNRDGIVLDDPDNKASKIKTKDQVISSIVGYKPQTLVSIEYIPSMDDWKTAWNHIHFQGFLGTPMILQFIWQGCDSILAGPLVLDLARLALLAKQRKEHGVLTHLACFFKGPMGVQNHDFFEQFQMLRDYAIKAGGKG
ncbi:MAG: myo-inositol-1-phosphate synthase [Gemmataceae bacterium]|nr:myo-inositol-1-phosphate synthase [Gemmataceae bacterium]